MYICFWSANFVDNSQTTNILEQMKVTPIDISWHFWRAKFGSCAKKLHYWWHGIINNLDRFQVVEFPYLIECICIDFYHVRFVVHLLSLIVKFFRKR